MTLGVVGPFIEPIKGLRGDRVEIIELVDRLRIEVYQHTMHSDLFDDMGGEVRVEFSYPHSSAAGRGGWHSARHPLVAMVL